MTTDQKVPGLNPGGVTKKQPLAFTCKGLFAFGAKI
jgi:hypothetical protein